MPGDSHKLLVHPTDFTISSVQSFGSVTASKKENGSLRLQNALSILRTAASTVSSSEVLKALPMQRNRRMRPNLEPIFQLLSGMYFPKKQDIFSRSGRVSPSVLMWATLKYSLISTEIAARCGKSSLSSRNGLSSLYDEFKSSSGFILPLLLKIIQSTRSKNVPDLLLRFRGLQLFSASICSGIVYDKGHGEGIGEGGRGIAFNIYVSFLYLFVYHETIFSTIYIAHVFCPFWEIPYDISGYFLFLLCPS